MAAQAPRPFCFDSSETQTRSDGHPRVGSSGCFASDLSACASPSPVGLFKLTLETIHSDATSSLMKISSSALFRRPFGLVTGQSLSPVSCWSLSCRIGRSSAFLFSVHASLSQLFQTLSCRIWPSSYLLRIVCIAVKASRLPPYNRKHHAAPFAGDFLIHIGN